ncbi:MAG: HD domain-containing phosphohydrolase [Caldisericia bacterium]
MGLKEVIKDQLYKLNSLIDDLIKGEEEQKKKIKDLVSTQRILRGINELLISERDEKDLFDGICDILTTHEDIKIALIGLSNDNKDKIKEFYIKGDGELIKMGNFSISDKIFTPLRTGEIFIDNNYIDKNFNDEIKSIVSLPIFYESNPIGILTIFSNKQNFFFDEILLFLKEVSGDISLGFKDIKQRIKIENLLNTIKNALFDLSISLSKIAELRDPLTKNHGENVGKLALKIGEKLNLDKEKLDFLYLASLLHDIGKISIPIEVLNKPSKLSDIEYDLVKMHPQIAYDYLKDIKLPLPIAEIVLEHHEREDGSGYPKGLKNDEIMIEAKIIAVSEVIHAMNSFKPYRPAYTIGEALNYIQKESGKLFDKKVVNACVEVFKEGFSFE